MHSLEDGNVVANIRRGSETESAGEPGGQVAQNVAVHVRRDDDIELLGPHRELMGAVVDQDMLRRNHWILRRKFLEGALQQTLGELHDVRLRCAMNRLTSLGERECECELDDLLASFARDQLETLRHPGGLHVLDARVQVLDVLADDDDVELAAGEGGLHTWQLTDWSDVAVRLEQGAKRDVGASVAVADRCLEGTLEHNAGALYRLDRFLRNSGDDPLFKCPPACLAFPALGSGACSLCGPQG